MVEMKAKRTIEDNEGVDVTVDDLAVVIRELEARLSVVEDVLRRHEHNSSGRVVIQP